ncbi:helix-turn-helix domain-containing protein [Fimbriiglobus ruber]
MGASKRLFIPKNPHFTMNLVELGQRIQRLRTDRRMTLEEVATQARLTRSQLSKVENFRVTPSLPALERIAVALGTTLSDLVRGLDEQPPLVHVRPSERKAVRRDGPGSKFIYHSLAHKRPGKLMEPFVVEVPPGNPRAEALGHEGEEFLLVLNGCVDFHYGDQHLRLETGDSVYFDGTVPHRFDNPNPYPIEMLIVYCAGVSSGTTGERVRPAARERQINGVPG